MTEEDEEDYKINNIRCFCQKNIESDKVRDQCHLTGNYRGTAHNTCNINATQKQSNFVPVAFQSFGNYGCHLFLRS